jgi:predicted GNAT family N-acyltransferase
MEIQIYSTLPPQGRWIREEVFVREQGFREEFDSIDSFATHILVLADDSPAGICRVFWDEDRQQFLLGRVAVLSRFRRQGLGEALVTAAEQQVRRMGGASLHLHAQCRITGFYEAVGYTPYGEIEDDQGCPHIWMQKSL